MTYESIRLNDAIHIDNVYTIHYFEYRNDFEFSGERHDFWEFQCVDKGTAEISTDNGTYVLSSGQAIFHKPNEFHSLKAAKKSAPNIVVVSFSCNSPAMDFFRNQILDINQIERSLMGLLISEARHCIASPLNDPYLKKMETRQDSVFGSQQLIRLLLEELLITLIRRHMEIPITDFLDDNDISLDASSEIYDKIHGYLEKHLRNYVTIDEICHDNLIGRSQLQKLFRERHHCGVIEYFSRMKIDLAKQLIRENQMNFTQIAEYLGYSSIHYFSRQFKKISGMTPSEYTISIKAFSERS